MNADTIVRLLTEEDDDFDVKELVNPDQFRFKISDPNYPDVWDVFLPGGKWLGRISKRDKHGSVGWQPMWMPLNPDHPSSYEFPTPQVAAQWMADHRTGYMEAINDEENTGEMNVNKGLYVGTRVRVINQFSRFFNLPGTVVGKSSFGKTLPGEHSFWVHFDDDTEDMSSASTFRGEDLEATGDLQYPTGMRVKITAGQYAGSKGYVTGIDSKKDTVFVHPDRSPDEWQSVEIPTSDVTNVNEAKKIIAEVIGDEEGTSEMGLDPLAMSVQALKEAGFKIVQAERIEDEWLIKFTWPSPNAVAYINGAKRAKEALRKFIQLDPHHYTVKRTGDITTMLIRKKAEEDPTLWKLVPPERDTFQGHWKILYDGKQVAEIYTTDGGAQRVRDEMIALHKTAFFAPQEPGVGWNNYQGDAWASGPAVGWWRANRKFLPRQDRVASYFVDKAVLGEQ